jgi:hypothetical protein
MRKIFLLPVLLWAALAMASIFGVVRGIVHDPQHRPIAGAKVTLKSADSDWARTVETNSDGEFIVTPVPLGDYTMTVSQAGFADSSAKMTVASNSTANLHFELKIAAVNEAVNVTAEPEPVNVDSTTTTTLLDRGEIARTPGANQTNSLAMITDYVPGAYMVHDQLHIRGGHQVQWLVDGVPVPNTNIASNVGPQFDPKDIDYLEVHRGGYEADEGDRTYGIFNVVPRTGFERNNEAELVASAGNFYQTNDQLNFGSHTDRFAYYASLNGNRSDLGLETPVGKIIHDRDNGYGGFGSLIFNVDPKDQLRLVTSARHDYYQIPNTPEQQAAGIRDGEHEGDAFVNFSWVRTINSDLLLTVSPFYHFNSANFEGAPADFPISTTDERASNFAGLQTTLAINAARNNAQFGFYGFGQHDSQLFGLLFNDHSTTSFRDRELATGGVEEGFIEDKLKVTSWLTLTAGVRQTHFAGNISEDATSPRVGAAVQVPRLRWVFRGFYGHYYQPPPLLTASGPLLSFVTNQSLGFIPLRGERDEEHQFGVTIPYRGWAMDIDEFRTRAKNFFDHNNVGNSDVFFPLTIDGALVRGWELTLRSPRLWNRGQVHLAYSNQIAQARGAITGGLTDFSPPPVGYFLLDHDQTNTLNAGFDYNLPWHAFASTNVYYGSGFSNGNPPPDHLPGHTTFDLSLGKDFERFSVSLNGLNVANRHLLIDNSTTFGGTHYNNPRELFVQVRYRFHY